MYKIIRRNPRSRLNQIFSLFILCLIINYIINISIAYSNIQNSNLLIFWGQIYFFFYGLAIGFFFLYILLLYKPKTMTEIWKQIVFILLFGSILAIMFFIPDGFRVDILPTGLNLSINLPQFIHLLIIFFTSFSCCLWMGLKIFQNFDRQILKKRFIFFLVGLSITFFIPLLLVIRFYINVPALTFTFEIIILVLSFGIFLIYYGIGMSIKENNLN